MLRTLDLVDRALAQEANQAHWCRELGIGRNTLAVARHRGQLSPAIAGHLAELLGEEPTLWIALAALETAPPSAARDRLHSTLAHPRKKEQKC